MPSPQRRKLDELIAMYQLEPSLRDVYVEGSADQSFIEWFLHEYDAHRAGVKPIDCVEIPSDTVRQLGFENSNRGRVIALAHLLQQNFGGDTRVVTCLVDGDFDRVLGRRYDCDLLLLTDYTALEVYFFEARPLGKFLELVVRRFPKPAKTVLSEIQQPLRDLFVVRMANHILGWGLRQIPFDGCCKMSAGGVHFALGAYLDRYLNANRRRADKQAFLNAIAECRARLRGNVKQEIHGHDFLELLSWYLRQHKGFKSIRKDLVERSIFACAEPSDLVQQEMFRILLERVRER